MHLVGVAGEDGRLAGRPTPTRTMPGMANYRGRHGSGVTTPFTG